MHLWVTGYNSRSGFQAPQAHAGSVRSAAVWPAGPAVWSARAVAGAQQQLVSGSPGVQGQYGQQQYGQQQYEREPVRSTGLQQPGWQGDKPYNLRDAFLMRSENVTGGPAANQALLLCDVGRFTRRRLR